MSDFVGRGWSFPPRLNDRNRMSVVAYDADIRQAIYIIIMTVPGERVMRPDFGCLIHELIFAPANDQTAAVAERYVREAITRWEPRIVLQELKVTPGGGARPELLIDIKYQIKGQHDVRSLVFPYYLTPEEG
jgi:hypothetical protein